jgi:hypothetical protein
MSHWETVTFIAGLRQTGIVAPMNRRSIGIGFNCYAQVRARYR